MALLEICCYSMECARMAQQNGADRIELCSAPKEGGFDAVPGRLAFGSPAYLDSGQSHYSPARGRLLLHRR